jgi:Myb/SANT-like DNA-binding domain
MGSKPKNGNLIVDGEPAAKKARSDNWTKAEVDILISCVEPHYEKLYGKLSNTTTSKAKNIIWATVADKVRFILISRFVRRNTQSLFCLEFQINACSGTIRDTKSIKNKLKDMKTRAKEAASRLTRSRRKTGGGESDIDDEDDRFRDLQDWQRRIINLMQVECVDGVRGGIDTSRMSRNSSE